MSGSILVLEDDLATAGLIRTALDLEGYAVQHAVGAAGLALAQVARPAVIFLDINIPGMDGLEVSRRLRADPRTAHIPIVCMSSHVASGRDGIPPEMAHDDRLSKPFALDDLIAVVARWAGSVPSGDARHLTIPRASSQPRRRFCQNSAHRLFIPYDCAPGHRPKAARAHESSYAFGPSASILRGCVLSSDRSRYPAHAPVSRRSLHLARDRRAARAWGLGILRETVDILMEATPKDLNIAHEVRAMVRARQRRIADIHDLHVWSIAGGMSALSAHVQVADRPLSACDELLVGLNHLLQNTYKIGHSTIQIECAGRPPTCTACWILRVETPTIMRTATMTTITRRTDWMCPPQRRERESKDGANSTITLESPRTRKERDQAVPAGVRVEQLTIGWMTGEAIVAITAGLLVRSVFLTAFGVDSVIELVTGGVLLWRLSTEARGGSLERVERAENRAAWVTGIGLVLLCAYIVGSVGVGLWTQSRPESAPAWMAIMGQGGVKAFIAAELGLAG